jgi:hypothetical protein
MSETLIDIGGEDSKVILLPWHKKTTICNERSCAGRAQARLWTKWLLFLTFLTKKLEPLKQNNMRHINPIASRSAAVCKKPTSQNLLSAADSKTWILKFGFSFQSRRSN